MRKRRWVDHWTVSASDDVLDRLGVVVVVGPLNETKAVGGFCNHFWAFFRLMLAARLFEHGEVLVGAGSRATNSPEAAPEDHTSPFQLQQQIRPFIAVEKESLGASLKAAL